MQQLKRAYGHTPVVDGLVPRLTGLECGRERLVKGARKAPSPPLVEIIGGRLSGKTLLLRELAEGYRNRIPMTYVDLAKPWPGHKPDSYGATASPVVHLLPHLTYWLGRTVPGYGRIRFRRLQLGLEVVWRPASNVDPTSITSLRDAEAKLRDFLEEANAADRRRLQELLGRWLTALKPILTATLPALVGADEGTGADKVAQALMTTAVNSLRAARMDLRAVAWWGRRLRDDLGFQGDDLQCLLHLKDHFPAKDEADPKAERLLLEALLADISAYYGPVRRFNRRHPPLILLDNLHVPVGAHFWTRLVEAYAAAEGRVRPVVVATSLGHPTEKQRRAFARADGATASPSRTDRVIRLGIPAISAEAFGDRRFTGGRLKPHQARHVRQLSCGRPGWASVLARAAARGPLSDYFLHHDGSAEDWLLELLYPNDADLQSDLTLLAPALDTESAHRLWARHGAHRGEERLHRALAELRADHWTRERWCWPAEKPDDVGHCPGPEVPLVGDRALRTLLLANLARTSSPERWRELHASLREQYLRGDQPSGERRYPIAHLHHTLAMGEVDTVVRQLHARLDETDPATWLTAVNVVCAAPHPPPGTVSFQPDQTGGRYGAVHHLVTVLWQASDPLRAEPTGSTRLRSALNTLYDQRFEIFNLAAEVWPAKLAEGVRAPDLPVPTRVTGESGS